MKKLFTTLTLATLICACSRDNKNLYGVYESKRTDSLGYSKFVLYPDNHYSVKSNSCLTLTQDTGTFALNGDTLYLTSSVDQATREKNKTYTKSNNHKLISRDKSLYCVLPVNSRTKFIEVDTINFWTKK